MSGEGSWTRKGGNSLLREAMWPAGQVHAQAAGFAEQRRTWVEGSYSAGDGQRPHVLTRTRSWREGSSSPRRGPLDPKLLPSRSRAEAKSVPGTGGLGRACLGRHGGQLRAPPAPLAGDSPVPSSGCPALQPPRERECGDAPRAPPQGAPDSARAGGCRSRRRWAFPGPAVASVSGRVPARSLSSRIPRPAGRPRPRRLPASGRVACACRGRRSAASARAGAGRQCGCASSVTRWERGPESELTPPW